MVPIGFKNAQHLLQFIEVETKKEDQHLAADTSKEEAAEKRLAEETSSPRKGARAL